MSVAGVIIVILIGMMITRYRSRPFRPYIRPGFWGGVNASGPMPTQNYGQPYQPQAYPMMNQYGGQGAYAPPSGPLPNGPSQEMPYQPPPGPPPSGGDDVPSYAPPSYPPPGHNSERTSYQPPAGPPPNQS